MNTAKILAAVKAAQAAKMVRMVSTAKTARMALSTAKTARTEAIGADGAGWQRRYGADGKDGKDGADGADGKDGADGTDGNITLALEAKWFEGNDLLAKLQDLGILTTEGPFDTIIMSMTADQYEQAVALISTYDISASIEATVSDDYLVGDDTDNTIDALPGDDVLIGLGGADTLNGNDGNDTASYISSGDKIFVDLAYNLAQGGDAEGDQFISIENVIGSAFNDKILGDEYDNLLSGGEGNDFPGRSRWR